MTSRGSQTSQGLAIANKGDPRYKDLLKEKKTSSISAEVSICFSFILHFFWVIWSKAEFDKSKFSTKVLIILKYNQIKRVATNIDFLLVPSFDVIHSSQTAAFELSLKTPHYHHLCLLMATMMMMMLLM